MAADHFWSEGLEDTDACRGPGALRGGRRRPPRGARLPPSLPAPARGEAGSGSTDPRDFCQRGLRLRETATECLGAMNTYVFIVGHKVGDDTLAATGQCAPADRGRSRNALDRPLLREANGFDARGLRHSRPDSETAGIPQISQD